MGRKKKPRNRRQDKDRGEEEIKIKETLKFVFSGKPASAIGQIAPSNTVID